MNHFVNQVKVQQLFPLSIRVPNSNTKRIGLFQEKKISLKRRRNKVSSCTHQSDLPFCMEPVGPKGWFLDPTAKCWGRRCHFGEFWRTNPRETWSRQLLEPDPKLSNQVGCPEAARLLADSSQFVTKPKLILFDAREASKVKDELLGQGIAPLFRKPTDQKVDTSWNHLAWVRLQDSFILNVAGVKPNTSCFRSTSGRGCVFVLPAVIHRWAYSGCFLWVKESYFSLMLITWETGFPEMCHYV